MGTKEGCMKIANRILEYVGDGKYEAVTKDNFGHLEIGDHMMKYKGEPGVKVEFLGWVVPDTNGKKEASPDEDDPEKVNLLFRDVADKFNFEAYHFKGKYCVGSSADPIEVKQL